MEKAMAPHSSTLAWKIPWTEEPGGLQSMGLLGVGHDWATSCSLSCIGEGNGNPLQRSCLENPRDGGAWWAAVYGVTQSRTWLKWLSSRSSSKAMWVEQYQGWNFFRPVLFPEEHLINFIWQNQFDCLEMIWLIFSDATNTLKKAKWLNLP